MDDFDSEALSPLRGVFMDGAYFACGHTALQRALGLGYQSDWAQDWLPTRKERNAFYTAVGKAVEPGGENLERLRGLDPALAPEALLDEIQRLMHST